MTVESPELPRGLVPPLPARLAPPRLGPALVDRARLVQRLTSLPPPAVYVVHAPPGYGKSTLAAQFAEADGRPLAWLTLDEQDADPVKCVSDVVFALSDVDDGALELLERLASGPAAVPAALPRLARLLGERWQASLIVLDDVHHAAGEAGDVLGALVRAVPDGSTMILAGRVRPSLPIARLVADGHLETIDARVLRMTVGEGNTMLARRGVAVDDQEAELLVRRTEGWPAALYLVAHALKDGDAGGIAAPDEEGLIDYFRDEVLRTVEPADVRFLLESAVLDELSPATCDAVLGRSDSAQRLASLADADLFVAPLDAHHNAYRVHGLFREALYQRLAGSHHQRVAELHGRASDYHAGRGEIEAAVRHALAAGRTEAAANLVWSATPAYEGSGRGATVAQWLELFSPEDFEANPCLAVAAAWVAINEGDGAAVEHWTTVALNAPADLVLVTGESIGASAQLLDAILGKRGVATVRSAAASADALLPDGHVLKAVAKFVGGAAAHMADDVDAARVLLADAQALASSTLSNLYWLALAELAVIAIDDGDWDEAEACMERGRIAGRAGLQDYTTRSLRRAVDARIGAHRGEQLAARQAALDAKSALAAHRHYAAWFAAQARTVLAQAFIELEWPAEARRMVTEAQRLVAGDPGAVRVHRQLDELSGKVGRGTGSISGGEALSTAELRTLEYLQTHLTQREIAERLHLTRNTVHTHTSAIYRKLAVTSRSEAVGAGRHLGLLDG